MPIGDIESVLIFLLNGQPESIEVQLDLHRHADSLCHSPRALSRSRAEIAIKAAGPTVRTL